MTKDKFLSFSESGFGMPQEEVLEKTHGKKQLNIGIPYCTSITCITFVKLFCKFPKNQQKIVKNHNKSIPNRAKIYQNQ